MINQIVKIVNASSNELPQYSKIGDSGIDVRANLPNGPVQIISGERLLIDTGLSVAIPEGYEIQVRPRSGLAYKEGITVLNTPGTIDSNYRGNIGVILMNHNNNIEPFVVKHGDRIAQLVLTPVNGIIWNIVKSLEDTNRGEDGFGSTGVK
jgi:dUTP pyrophosphatase